MLSLTFNEAKRFKLTHQQRSAEMLLQLAINLKKLIWREKTPTPRHTVEELEVFKQDAIENRGKHY